MYKLRGILICPKCGKQLTASCSKGKMGQLYPYYHCSQGCKERQKAELVNEAFVELLQLVQPKPNSVKLFCKLANEKLKNNNTTGKAELEKVNKEIAKQNQRISNARSLMLDGEIDAIEFKSMRIEIEEKITQLTCELNNVSASMNNIGSKLAEATDLISNLEKQYIHSETAVKRQIVNSVFPLGLIFDNKKVRTLQLNKVMSQILSVNKVPKDLKKESTPILVCFHWEWTPPTFFRTLL